MHNKVVNGKASFFCSLIILDACWEASNSFIWPPQMNTHPINQPKFSLGFSASKFPKTQKYFISLNTRNDAWSL